MRVLSFGEILWDVIDGKAHLGGAPFNFAAHSVQCGNEAFIISRLGNDQLGLDAYNQCKLHGVNTALIQWDTVHPTGTVDVSLTNGQPDYTIARNVAYDFIEMTKALENMQDHFFFVFYFGSLSQRSQISGETLHALLKRFTFKNVFYDVNLRKDGYSEQIVRNSLAACTIFKLNHEEVPVLSAMLFNEKFSNEKFCEALCRQFPRLQLAIVTASDKGCFVYDRKTFVHTPCAPVTVTDAVGAGDAFSAAFMHIFTTTGNPVESSVIANEVGGYVASKAGAIPPYSENVGRALLRAVQRIRI